MATQIKLRRDSYQNWYNANPTLALGEPAYDTTNNKLKIGNGTSAWRSLGYLADSTATSQLVNGDLTVSLNNKGTLTVPHLLPKTFTATVDDAHYAGTLTLTDDAWHFDVTFSANNNGTVTTYIDNQTPWASNPGYTNNMEFTFTEADHGIPDYTFTMTLVDIQNPGPMMYTTNLTASQPPAYPTTISNGESIKFVADASTYIMGADGNLRAGYFSGTTQQTFFANSDGVGIRIDSFNTPTTVDIGDNGYDNLRIIYGVQSVNGNPGDVEIQSTPIGSPAAPSSISISPQGGQDGSFTFGSTGTLTRDDRLTVNSGGATSGYTAAVIADGDLGKVLMRTDDGTTTRTWEFNKEGNLVLPNGGDIKDSAGNSVLGGGSGAGDRLVNGFNELVLDANGNLAPETKTVTTYNGGTNTAPTLTIGTLGSASVITQPETDSVNTGGYAIRIQGQRGYGTWANTEGNGGWGGHVEIWGGQGGETGGATGSVSGGEGGYIDLRGGDGQAGRDGGAIYLRAGDTTSSLGWATTVYGGDVDISAGNATNSIEPNFGEGGNVVITAGLGNKINGNIQFNAGQGSWRFNADGSFSINGNEVSIATNNWGITVGGGIGATGVVYTAKQLDLASIRAHVTIEGNEDGDATGIHTQACDVMVVRRVAIGGAVTVDAVVYGVIYTGAAPLATLDAQWNPTGGPNASGRIEITATPTSATNNVYVKVYATEVARGD